MGEIRILTKYDLAKVMKIWLEASIEFHSFIGEDFWRECYGLVEELLPFSSVFLYENEDKIQGFIAMTDNYIQGLFVEKHSRGRGIGKLLLNYVKELYDSLFLHIYKRNSSAANFYLNEGFSIIGERIDESTGETALLMEWNNNSPYYPNILH